MTQERFADHLGVAVRTVGYWQQRPDSVPQQQMQEILDTALERASDQNKARFARMMAQVDSATDVRTGSERQSAKCDHAQDAAGLAVDSGRAIVLLDGLIGADIADRLEVPQASWISGTAPAVIAGYLFSSPRWHHEEEPLAAAPNTAAARIRAVAQHLMDIDFQFGGGYVRRMLLSYFQSEIAPLLRESHPESVRREIFSAAAEVAQQKKPHG